MSGLAYLFERFPAFGQTFCYREVAELKRQGCDFPIFSIRKPVAHWHDNWDSRLTDSVQYLPPESELLDAVESARRAGSLPSLAVAAIDAWKRRGDFLRLQQAAYLGPHLRAGGVRHIHAHFAGMAARTAYWIHKFFGLSYSFTAHANDIFVPSSFEIGLPQIVESAAAVIVVSDFAANFLRDRYRLHASKLHRIYNGVEIGQPQPLDHERANPLVLSVGRLIAKKGFGHLITACAVLRDRGCAFRCEIIGDGPLRAELEQQIHSAHLESIVRLRGAQDQAGIAASLASAALFVLPSVVDRDGGMDNLPTVIMEAMAAGLPVVATRLAGIPEMVVDQETGRLVPEHDAPAIASAIEELLDDRRYARALGERGKAVATERFSISANVSALASIFGRFLGS